LDDTPHKVRFHIKKIHRVDPVKSLVAQRFKVNMEDICFLLFFPNFPWYY